MILTGEFKKYQYELVKENMEAYGQELPPFYDTDNI